MRIVTRDSLQMQNRQQLREKEPDAQLRAGCEPEDFTPVTAGASKDADRLGQAPDSLMMWLPALQGQDTAAGGHHTSRT